MRTASWTLFARNDCLSAYNGAWSVPGVPGAK